MKKLLYEFKNKITFIYSSKKYLQLISFILFFISLYFFSSYLYISIYSNNFYLDEKKHLRNLDSMVNQNNKTIFNETLNGKQNNNNNSYLIEINNTSDDINYAYINDSSIDNNNISNNEMNLIVRVRPLKINVTEKIIFYEFIKNITTGFYFGDWNNLSVKKNRFHDKKGKGYLYF